MPNVTASGIVTPDEDDLDDPEVYLAAMADSIESGIGARLTAQESVVGLKVVGGSLPMPPEMALVPYYFGGSGSCFSTGIGYAGGVATIRTKGLYFVTSSVTMDPTHGGDSVACNIVYNASSQLEYNEIPKVNTVNWVSAKCATVVVCQIGDTLSAEGKIIGTGQTASVPEASCFNVALIAAMP